MKNPPSWRRTKSWKREKIVPLRIVGNATESHPEVGDGRFLPILLVDCSDRPDIREYLKAHQGTGPGDVISTWGRAVRPKTNVTLGLEVKRPVELTFHLTFDIYKDTTLISLILDTGAVWIQAGRPGEKFSDNLFEPRVLMEIPDSGFRDTWNKQIREILYKRYRRQGIPRLPAKAAVDQALANYEVLRDHRQKR